MKSTIITVTLLVAMLVAGTAASGEDFTRIGFSIGGIHLVGLFVERGIGADAAVRAQVGYLLNAVSLNLSAIRYFDIENSKHRPYAGIGFMKHLCNLCLQNDSLICFPVGMDFHFAGKSRIGAELIPAVSLSVKKTKDGERRNFSEYVLPLPSLYYKYEL